MTTWYRVEGRTRSPEMTGGVEARVADPLWMLARQWQVGEFIGDDAGTPLAVHTRYESTEINELRAGPDRPATSLDANVPLERRVEATALPRQAGASIAHGVRSARRLVRRLESLGAGALVERLQEAFPLTDQEPVTLGARGDAATHLLRRRSFDGLAVAALNTQELHEIVGSVADIDVDAVSAVLTTWSSEVRRQYNLDDGAWRADRMEHSFRVTAPTTGDPLVLEADGYTGGRLDWYSFEIREGHAEPLADELDTLTTIPTPARYDGMPASRWWEFEDGGVQFGDIDAGPTDLARMIVADFATVYGDDWYVVPLELDVGTVARVVDVEIVDVFGERTRASSIVATDERGPLSRSWSMFELHGDISVDKERAPLLFVPPALAGSLHGPATETVEFARDEGANLGWAIERLVEGPLGRSVDRRDSWLAATPPAVSTSEDSGEPTRYEDQTFSYRAESSAPPHWVPLLPERIRDDRPDIHFRRGRLQSWEHLDARVQPGAHGETLEPHHRLIIREEEIPRGGITVERRWQYARWVDGSVHLWVQRRRRQGRGDRTSGLRWDVLEPSDRTR